MCSIRLIEFKNPQEVFLSKKNAINKCEEDISDILVLIKIMQY